MTGINLEGKRVVNALLLSLILLLFALFFNTAVFANPAINEIMYNPVQSNYYNEWIELYNPENQSIDLTNWTICGDELLSGYVNHTEGKTYLNTSMLVPAYGYALVTDGVSGTDVYKNFNVSSNATVFHVSSASLCGGLSNSGDVITLNRSIGALIDSVNYTTYIAYANGNNKTLERINLTNAWAESISFGGTPGFENSVNTAGVNQSNQSESQNQTNQNLTNNQTNQNQSETQNQTNQNQTNQNQTNQNQTNNQSNQSNQTNPTNQSNQSNPTNQSEQQAQSDSKIELTLNTAHLNINENLIVFVNLTGNSTGNLSIKIKRNTHAGWKEVKAIFTKNNISNFIGELNWTVTEDSISGEYKVYARFEYPGAYTSSTEIFNVSGVSDIGEYNLTIISSPQTARFGGYEIILIKFNSNNYNFPVLRFVSYVNHNADLNKTRCISMDLNKEDGCTKVYNLNTVIELSNISRAQTVYLAVPLLFKWNCDRDYPGGRYTGKVRAYEYTGSEWSDLIGREFNITVSGKNKDLCEEKIKYVEKKDANSTQKENPDMLILDEIRIEVLNTSSKIETGKEFTTRLMITNTGTKNLNGIKIYSYIYKGSKVLSVGFNEALGVWKSDWAANQKVLDLAKGKSLNVTLESKIRDETATGVYDFKIRTKAGDKDYDIKREISVIEKDNKTKNSTVPVNETNAANETELENASNSEADIIVFDNLIVELLNTSCEADAGGEFTTCLKITNTGAEDLNEIKIYSYAYNGSSVVSSGFNETSGSWKSTWTANQKSLAIQKGNSIAITMKNKIRDETEPDTYDFKIRLKAGNKNYDINREINVMEKKITETSAAFDEREMNRTYETKTAANKSSNREVEIRELQPYDLKPYFVLTILLLSVIVFAYMIINNKKK